MFHRTILNCRVLPAIGAPVTPINKKHKLIRLSFWGEAFAICDQGQSDIGGKICNDGRYFRHQKKVRAVERSGLWEVSTRVVVVALQKKNRGE
jgi:hypothetical protein